MREKMTNILLDAQRSNMTGTLQINGARMPVRITGVSDRDGKFLRAECAVLAPPREMPFIDEWGEYYRQDIERTKQLMKNMLNTKYGMNGNYGPQIKDVIFNPPATIVFWKDGTKTVVKCQEEDLYDPEKGLAMAIAKKAMGNKYSYYNTFKHWLKKWPKDYVKQLMTIDEATYSGSCFSQLAARMAEALNVFNKEN